MGKVDFKSRDLKGLKGSALESQMKTDAREAMGYYGETLDIRRPSLKSFLPEGRELPVSKVRLVYEGGALKPMNERQLSLAMNGTQDAFPGLEVLFQ